MRADRVPLRALAGAAAGLAGTFALQGIMSGSGRWAPSTLPPIRQDPAEFMVGKAKSVLTPSQRAQLPPAAEAAAERALHLGYGTTFGLLYGLMATRVKGPVAGGVLLGLAVWATGYLGWLPALGLLPPLHQQEPPRVAGPIVSHVLYGLAVAAAYRWLNRRLSG